MNTALLERRFSRIGARVKVRLVTGHVGRSGIDIRSDDEGEYFDIRLEAGERVEYVVTDVRPEARRLLLMARRGASKEKFLCGHDERHWFVCAVPAASAPNVRGASAALRPADTRGRVARRIRRIKGRLRLPDETAGGELFT